MKEPILLLPPHTLGLPHHITYTWLLMLILLIVGIVVRPRLQMVPGKFQVILETVVGGIYDFFHDVLGHETRRFYPLIATLGIYIFLCNVMSLIPLFDSPTNVLNTTLAMAILVFVYYNYVGIKKHGFGYIKHFLGPIPWLAPLFLVVEIISHFSRMLSLSFRLFGNIRGKDILLGVLFFLVVLSKGILFLVPLPIFVLGLFVSFIQALIFALLSAMYLAGAVEEEH
jgi:F-type H+-transporting ATPase subunit a